jgi:predicted HTH domain antitoxin
MDEIVLKVPLPKELVSMLGFAPAQTVQTIQELLAIGLYQEGRISSGKAAELLGMTKREFIRFLARKGIPYFDYSSEELAEEFKVVETWGKEKDLA